MPLAFSLPFASQIPPLLGFFLAALGVIILGISKSGFGGGVGIIAVPLFAIAFGAQRGNAILLPLLIAADIFSVVHHWGKWNKHVLRVLIPGTLFGIAAGSVILALLVSSGKKSAADALNLLTGIISVLYVVLDQMRTRLDPTSAKWQFKATHGSGFIAGTAVGVISTLAHAAGPVAAIFLLNQGLARSEFLGTTVIYFFGINTTKLIPYSIIPGLIDWNVFLVAACFLPFAPIGTWIGKRLAHGMSERIFRNTILVLVFVAGMQLIVESCTGVTLMRWLGR